MLWRSKTSLYNHVGGAKALFCYVNLQFNNSVGGQKPKAAERGRVNCPRASSPKGPSITQCFKIWGPCKVNQHSFSKVNFQTLKIFCSSHPRSASDFSQRPWQDHEKSFALGALSTCSLQVRACWKKAKFASL